MVFGYGGNSTWKPCIISTIALYFKLALTKTASAPRDSELASWTHLFRKIKLLSSCSSYWPPRPLQYAASKVHVSLGQVRVNSTTDGQTKSVNRLLSKEIEFVRQKMDR